MAHVRVLAFATLLVLGGVVAGCGGGGGSAGTGGPPPPPPATATPTPTPTQTPPTSSSQSVQITGTSPAAATVPTLPSGAGLSVLFPNTTGGSATATVTLQTNQPASTPVLQAAQRRIRDIRSANVNPVAFVTISANATVSFNSYPAFTFTYNTPPTPRSGPLGFYLALYDPSNPGAGWNIIPNPVLGSGNSIVVQTSPLHLTLQAGTTYVYVLFAPSDFFPTPSASAGAAAASCLSMSSVKTTSKAT